MIKRIVKIVVVALFVTYACWSLAYAKETVLDRQCNHISLQISDHGASSLVETKDVLDPIKSDRACPITKPISQVDLWSIEQLILSNQLIKSASCYHTTSGNVRIEIEQISPILRIVIGNQSWFLDSEGKLVELDHLYPYRVQVATGRIDYKYVKEYLYPFAHYLYNEPFWRTQVQQIVITDKQECILIPLVGDFKIEFGSLTDTYAKLDRLKTFLLSIPEEIGWNYYASVNIKNNNQIVCKRREK